MFSYNDVTLMGYRYKYVLYRRSNALACRHVFYPSVDCPVDYEFYSIPLKKLKFINKNENPWVNYDYVMSSQKPSFAVRERKNS